MKSLEISSTAKKSKLRRSSAPDLPLSQSSTSKRHCSSRSLSSLSASLMRPNARKRISQLRSKTRSVSTLTTLRTCKASSNSKSRSLTSELRSRVSSSLNGKASTKTLRLSTNKPLPSSKTPKPKEPRTSPSLRITCPRLNATMMPSKRSTLKR